MTYDEIAASLKHEYKLALRVRGEDTAAIVRNFVFHLADVFEGKDPGFDRERFVRGVGLMQLEDVEEES